MCVGTCSQHQWSVSALKAPKRRGATLGARHNAASTHPLSDFLSCPLSRSLSSLSLYLAAFPVVSLHRHLASTRLRQRRPPSFFIFSRHRRARNLRKSWRRHPPPPPYPLSPARRLLSSFGEKESSRILLPPRQPFPELLFLFFFSRFAVTRAGHVPYYWCRVDRVTEALFCELKVLMKT